MLAIFAVLTGIARIIAITGGERGVGRNGDEKRHSEDHEQHAPAHRMTSGSGNWKKCTPEFAKERVKI
jgi:hypothetical protein